MIVEFPWYFYWLIGWQFYALTPSSPSRVTRPKFPFLWSRLKQSIEKSIDQISSTLTVIWKTLMFVQIGKEMWSKSHIGEREWLLSCLKEKPLKEPGGMTCGWSDCQVLQRRQLSDLEWLTTECCVSLDWRHWRFGILPGCHQDFENTSSTDWSERMGSVGTFKTKVNSSILCELDRQGRLFRNPDRRKGTVCQVWKLVVFGYGCVNLVQHQTNIIVVSSEILTAEVNFCQWRGSVI